jgi:hypothetical protein
MKKTIFVIILITSSFLLFSQDNSFFFKTNKLDKYVISNVLFYEYDKDNNLLFSVQYLRALSLLDIRIYEYRNNVNKEIYLISLKRDKDDFKKYYVMNSTNSKHFKFLKKELMNRLKKVKSTN